MDLTRGRSKDWGVGTGLGASRLGRPNSRRQVHKAGPLRESHRDRVIPRISPERLADGPWRPSSWATAGTDGIPPMGQSQARRTVVSVKRVGGDSAMFGTGNATASIVYPGANRGADTRQRPFGKGSNDLRGTTTSSGGAGSSVCVWRPTLTASATLIVVASVTTTGAPDSPLCPDRGGDEEVFPAYAVTCFRP